MRTRHYHVMYQAVGCLPDDNHAYTSRAAASAAAREMVALERENGAVVYGSALSGRYDIKDTINCITIDRCDDRVCAESWRDELEG